MKITSSKLIIGSVLIFIFLSMISLATFFALNKIKISSQKNILKSLQTINQTTQESLEIWVKFLSLDLVEVTYEKDIINLTQTLVTLHNNRKDIVNSHALKQLRALVTNMLSKHDSNGFFLISPDRTNIAAVDDEEVGNLNNIHKQRQDYLDRVFAGETLFIPTVRADTPLKLPSGEYQTNLPTIFMATPIFNIYGKTIAALAIRLDPSKDFTRIIHIGRIGDTGETYAFDDSARLITESRFNDQLQRIGLIKTNEKSALSIRVTNPDGDMLKGFIPSVPAEQRPLTEMAKSAIAKNTAHNIEGYRDYRGVTVLGAWAWNKKFGFGIATEINRDEAMRPYYETRLTVITVLILTIFLSLALLAILLWMNNRSKIKLDKAYSQLEEQVNLRTHELACLNQELKQISLLDGLTNVANRRMFDQTLEHEWQRSLRNQTPLSLIMMDIDFFKQYNDEYGHVQGDACLKEIATLLTFISRRSIDLLCRYGGEEFVILLPNTDAQHAIQLAEKCRVKIMEQQIPHRASAVCDVVTISLGVSTMIATPEAQPTSLVNAADKLLYLAKDNGRNRVEHV